MIRVYVRMRKQVIIMSGLLLKIAQPVLSVSRVVINRAVPGMNPRVILFATRNLRILRVYIGPHLAGEYDTRKKYWSMLFPFQFVVDKNHLPTIDPPSRPDFLPPQMEIIQSTR